MSVRVIENEDEFDSFESEWNDLHHSIGGTVFQSFTWNRRWWALYRNSHRTLRIATIAVDGRLTGILPMFVDRFENPFMKFSRLRFLGTYEIYGEYAPLVHPDFADEVLHGMVSFCVDALEGDACTMISFFRYPIDSEFMRRLLAELHAKGLRLRCKESSIIRVVIDLPATWEEYLDSLSRSEKTILGRRMRSLRKLGADLEVATGATYRDADFDDFVRLHAQAWEEEGLPGYFASYKSFERFHRDTTAELAKANIARLYFLRLNGIRIAAVHAYVINGIACFYLSGMNRRLDVRRYSPGMVLLAFVIKDCIDGGGRFFDFQGGDEEYKYRLGGHRSAFSRARVWTPGISSWKIFVFDLLQHSYRLLVDGLWDRWHQHARRIRWHLNRAERPN